MPHFKVQASSSCQQPESRSGQQPCMCCLCFAAACRPAESPSMQHLGLVWLMFALALVRLCVSLCAFASLVHGARRPPSLPVGFKIRFRGSGITGGMAIIHIRGQRSTAVDWIPSLICCTYLQNRRGCPLGHPNQLGFRSLLYRAAAPAVKISDLCHLQTASGTEEPEDQK